MNAYLNYLLEANLGLAVFLIAYLLLLRRETDFRAKRAYLLICIITSLLFPLLHFTQTSGVPTLSTVVPPNWLPEFTITANGQASPQETTAPVSMWSTINKVYLVGVAVFLIVFLIRLTALLLKMRWSATYPYGKYRVVESNENSSSFSFFNFIFIGQAGQLSDNDKRQIICHESIHAKQLHSIDILLIQILGIFFWFNPLLVVYRKIFIQLHEFEADARAVEEGDANDYCSLMARVALLSADIKLANHFSNSLTLKRIEMIRTIRTRIGRWKFAAMGLTFPAFFIIVACQDQVSKPEAMVEAPVTPLAPVVTPKPISDQIVFIKAEEPASMVGGVEAIGKFLSENLRYPAEARQQGKEGTVYVKFIVNKDGTLSDFGIERGAGKALDIEALRVAKAMPAWNPARQNGMLVRQKFVLPIKFKLNGGTNVEPTAEAVTEAKPKPKPVARVKPLGSMIVGILKGPDGKSIDGKVVDKDGRPFIGANVGIKGTTISTTTGKDGKYHLEVGGEKRWVELEVAFGDYDPMSTKILFDPGK